jgi:chlorobactene glucosyltransferase
MFLPPPLSLLWLAPSGTIPLLALRRPALEAAPQKTGRSISVIVPARNEAENISACLASLLHSRYAPLEIVVVDDRSTDDTFALAEAVADRDSRVRVVRGAEPPVGWYGKPWACLQGYEAATGEILVFTDADTRHSPELLSHALGAFEAEPTGLLTVVTGQDCVTFWERLVMPQFWLPLGLRFHPLRVNAARHARDVIANGQFIMTTRDAYRASGTHAAVRGQVAEDLALAHVFHGHGLRVRMWWADDLIRTRMYTGFSHLVEGWSKNLFLGARASFPEEPILRAIAPVVVLLGICFWLVPLLAVVVTGGGDWALWAFAFGSGFWALISHGMGIPAWYGLLHPLGAAVAGAIVLRSLVRGGRKVEWRGRVYRDQRTG